MRVWQREMVVHESVSHFVCENQTVNPEKQQKQAEELHQGTYFDVQHPQKGTTTARSGALHSGVGYTEAALHSVRL